MTPERWQQVKDVFHQALELTPAERSSFLDRACSTDHSLRCEVESLLSSDGEARSNFLQAAPDAHPTFTRGTRLGDFEILSVLGAGGMGEVYRARDHRLERDVALKVLPTFIPFDRERLRRFEQEAKAAAALNHPNILAVFQMGTYENAPYLVSELLEGETLREQVKRGAVLLKKATDWGVQIAHGLSAAHEKGIVHRDLKPENLFVTRDGRIKILDFGLAKLTQPDSETHSIKQTLDTEPGVVLGTVGYMAPEQVRGEPADHRADIFSFGAILYELLSGQRTFHKPTSAETMSAILNEEPSGLLRLAPTVLPALQRVVRRCLEKAPEQRFQSASDLAFALEALSDADSAATVAIPQPAGRKNWKWKAAAGVAVVITAVLLVRWFGWSRWKAEPPTELAEWQLSANPPENYVGSGAISPDGKYLAYIDQTGLQVRSMVSGETRPVSLPAGLGTRLQSIRWLPEGGKLVADMLESPGESIWMLTLLGEAPPRKLLAHGESPDISPDGQWMTFSTGGRHENQEIWVSGINGEARRKLVDAEHGVIVSSPVWSPDAKSIAYWRGEETAQVGGGFLPGGYIEVRPASGGPAKTAVSASNLPKSIIPSCTWERCLCWSPDGRLIFPVSQPHESSPRPTSYSLWRVRMDPFNAGASSKPERISPWTDYRLLDLTTTADGENLAFVKTRYHEDVYVGELEKDGSSLKVPRRLTLDNRDSYPNSWTRDSKAILFFSNRNGRFQAFKQELAKGVPETFVTSSLDVDDPDLSPDGAWTLYWEFSEPTALGGIPFPARLMRQPTGGGTPERIFESADHEKTWYFCPQMAGHPCVLSQLEGKELAFYELDPVRGKGAQINKIEVVGDWSFYWQVSPDGSQLAVVDRNYKDRIKLLNLADRTWHDFAVEPGWDNFQSIAWAASGKGFFLTGGLPGTSSYNLLYVGPSGKVVCLLSNDRNQWMTQPRASPNGKYLAFQAQTWDSNVWLLEKPLPVK